MPELFSAPREDRRFEDYRPGAVHELGVVAVEELLRFAGRFDPQTMHVDEAAAKQSPFGDLIASGLQSLPW